MTPARATGPLRAAVPATGGPCFGHCKAPTRAHPVSLGAGGPAWVYACPEGVVSVVIAAGERRPDPATLRSALRARTRPPSTVRLRDFRSASRYGPELGRPSERALARSGRPIRLLYWRVYPWKVGDRPYSLFACFRHGPSGIRFYAAERVPKQPPCPFCSA